jgi:hypothetical protein
VFSTHCTQISRSTCDFTLHIHTAHPNLTINMRLYTTHYTLQEKNSNMKALSKLLGISGKRTEGMESSANVDIEKVGGASSPCSCDVYLCSLDSANPAISCNV